MKRSHRIRRARAVRRAEREMPQLIETGWQQMRERLLYPRTGLGRWFLRTMRRR